MPQLQVAITDRLRACATTTNAATLYWAMSRNKATSTLIMVCCLSMMDTLRCLLLVMVMEFYNCHQIEINCSHSCDCVCANNHTTKRLVFFVCFGTCRATVGVVGVQLLLSCCVRCLCCCEKDKRRLGRVRTKKNNGRSARFGLSLRCRFS